MPIARRPKAALPKPSPRKPATRTAPPAPARDVTAVIAQLLEAPWGADAIIPTLSKAEKAAVRAAMLAHATGDEPTSDAVSVLGHFPDDEVIDALDAVLANEDADGDVHDMVPEALAQIGTKRAQARLLELVDHASTSVARGAVENLPGAPAAIVKLLLSRFDELASRGDDLLTLAAVEHLVEHAPTRREVIEALARNWDFALRHDTTLMASNAIFDALVEHAPTSPVARAAFVAAAAHADEYGKVRGHAALALTVTGPALAEHVAAVVTLPAKAISTKQLRMNAMKQLATTRRAELAKLAKSGDRAAAKVIAKR